MTSEQSRLLRQAIHSVGCLLLAMSYDRRAPSSRSADYAHSSAAKVEQLRTSLRDLKSENQNLRRLIEMIKSNPNLFISQMRSSTPMPSSSSFTTERKTSSFTSTSKEDVSAGNSTCTNTYGSWATSTTPIEACSDKQRRVSFAEGSSTCSSRICSRSRRPMSAGVSSTYRPIIKPSTSKDSNGSTSSFQISNVHYPTKRCTSSVVPSKRILGEIAYQLERRILEHVFAHPHNTGVCPRQCRRFYGYTVSNIRTMIHQESTIDGAVDEDLKFQLNSRLRNIVSSLSPYGYKLPDHGLFAQNVINTHGLMRLASDSESMELFGLADADSLRGFIFLNVRDGEDRQNMIVLLESLLFLANIDGKSVFLW